MQSENYLQVGQIVNTHGVKGIVKIMPWCDDIETFLNLERVYLEDGRKLYITDAKIHRNCVLVKFDDIDDIVSAEKFKSRVIYAARGDIELSDDRVFIQDILGFEVFDIRQDKKLGVLKDVLLLPGNDVYVVKSDKSEYLIPAIKQFVLDIDTEKRFIKLKTIEGMAEDEN